MAANRTRSHSAGKAGSRGVPRAVREPQILEVAGRVFAAHGYHAASMDEIAAQADVTKPLVYAYFGSKENLYVAYIERSGSELVGRLRGAADPSAPPMERLQAGILEFLRFVDERRDGWRVLYSEVAARGGPLAEEVASLRAAVAEVIKRLLMQATEGVEASGERTAAFDGVAHAFVGAAESLANWWLAHPELPPERAADLLIAFGRAGVEQALDTAVKGARPARDDPAAQERRRRSSR
jgi:AcrR family transcriptional regulator